MDRESRLPLLIGAVFAVLLHAALAPVWGLGLSGVTPQHQSQPPEEDQALPEPREMELGRAHADVTNLAWIAYDDFQELLARLEVVEQPALQKQEEPVPDAPIEMDPTPPAPPVDDNRPRGGEQGGQPTPEPETLTVSPVGPVPLPEPEPEGELPYAPHGETPRDAELVVPGVSGEFEVKPAPEGESGKQSRPTSAPRDEAEAHPVTIIPGIVRVRPGAVLTADGIEIKTVVLRPSIAARYATVPRNPVAVIWFTPGGNVRRVELTKSTDAENWDDIVLTALEQWTATGERIKDLKGDLKLTVELILSRE